MRIASFLATMGVVAGVGWTVIKGLWGLIGFGQQANQLFEDLPAVVRAFDRPWAGPLLSLLSALLLALVWYADNYLKPKTAPSLAEKWFHTVDTDGNIHLQGHILRDEGPGRVFVQLFDFVLGNPSTQRYLTKDEITQLRVYDTNEAMQEEYHRRYPELHRW